MAYFLILKKRKYSKTRSNPNVLQQVNGEANCGVSIQWNITVLRLTKEQTIHPLTTWMSLKCTLLSERSCTKRGYITHDSVYMTFWKKQNYRKGAEKVSVVARVWDWEGQEGTTRNLRGVFGVTKLICIVIVVICICQNWCNYTLWSINFSACKSYPNKKN